MRANWNSDTRGFTLLEVMVAMAIVALALVTLLGLSSRSISVHDRLQKLTRATLLAQHLMSREEVLASGRQRGWLEQEETFAPPNQEFRWQVSYQDTVLPQVKQVRVSVLWGAPEKNQQVSLVSFLPAGGGT